MKTIEVIYPEFQNVYADLFQIEFFRRCNKDIKVVYTSYGKEPYFVKNKVDMIYMGSMPDSKIIPSIEKLSKYKDKIKELLEENVFFLVTGNAIEIFSSYILENNNKFNGLGLFNYYIEKDMNHKYVSWYIGNYKNIEIIGHKNHYSICKNIENGFINTKDGYSSDIKNPNEGIHYKNFYGTYLLGPFLIMNPKFTKFLLKELGLKDELIYEEDLIKAYKERVAHFKKPGTRFVMGDHG